VKIMHMLKHGVRGNGHVHVAVDLACSQADAGHEVVFACAEDGSYEELLRSHGVEVAMVPAAGGVGGALTSARALLTLCRRTRPDVLHAHMMSSAVLGRAVSAMTRIPMITTVHNSFEPHSVLMRLGRVVVAVSEAERRLLLSRRYPARKVVTVVNGADGSPREALDGEDLGPLKKPCVMVLSGLHPRKAVDDVIAAFALVSAEFPDWHLNVVGWGAERERLEADADRLGLADVVHFLGSTQRPRPLLDTADVFATATLADPCPLAVMEARAAGCAIVATSVGGIPETLEHGRAGQIVPPRDPAAMAEAFRTLMNDPAALASWRARSLDGAEHFTVARMAADYEHVYARVVRRTARSGR
jgi:glycosyltransferase involved in cell wall biosynthesis